MQRSTHTLLYLLLISLAILHRGEAAENKQSIASAEFLSVLAKNVATVLSPTLVGELQHGRPNRTALNDTTLQSIPTTSSTPKNSETTREPLKSLNLEADTVRSAQTQSEVGSGNQGFPYNYDDNYRYNYPGVNSQGLQRPDFPSGSPFGGHPGYYNPDHYRNYPLPTTGERRPDETSQRGEPAAGVSAVENVGSGQPGRALDSLDPTSGNFDRFRNAERFPFNNQFPGALGNFQNFPFSPERLQDGRFGDGRFGDARFGPFNGPGNPNLPGSPNFQNSIGNNYPRNNFQSFVDPFQQRQHAHGANSFDFLSSQRFQNPFDNYPRSQQRGPRLPELFYPSFVPGPRDLEGLATPAPKVDAKKTEQAASSEVKAKAEKLESVSKKNSSDVATKTPSATEDPQLLTIQGQVRFRNLFLPALEDYSDLRFRPDAFREYLFTPSDNNENKDKNDDNKNKKSKANIVNNNNNTTSGNVNDI